MRGTSRMNCPPLSVMVRGLGFSLIALTVTAARTVESRGEDQGRTTRIPWTSSRISGTPEPPPPYTVEPAFPRLKLEFPVVLVRAGGTGRLFAGELHGRIV